MKAKQGENMFLGYLGREFQLNDGHVNCRMQSLIVLMLLMASVLAGDVLGQERGYYTQDKLDNMQENLDRYEWARKEKARVIAEADKWVKYDDERLRTLVPPPEVPRATRANSEGDPIHGVELNKIGMYSWIVSFDKPYKVKSPVDGAMYPSNDYVAYMKSGFKDKSLLTGPYADDGYGAKVEGYDDPFWFVATYAHWAIRGMLLPALAKAKAKAKAGV